MPRPKKKRRRKPTLLSATRPPHSSSSTTTTLSSRATRTIIRTHHTLQKNLSTALQSQNTLLATSLQSQLTASHTLSLYQKASLTGQSRQRGGDSSRVLVDWVFPPSSPQSSPPPKSPLQQPPSSQPQPPPPKYRILEIGALTPNNAIARHPTTFEIERIDLHSQHPAIKTQDFMLRPYPTSAASAFDIVSLSLVLNYVGDAVARGEMLRRVARFLRPPSKPPSSHPSKSPSLTLSLHTPHPQPSKPNPLFPGLFLVLPSPCVTNSRYMDEERLGALMRMLGYVLARRKLTGKLVYYFWRWGGEGDRGVGDGKGGVGSGGGKWDGGDGKDGDGGDGKDGDGEDGGEKGKVFRKKEVRKGTGRNNFAVVLG